MENDKWSWFAGGVVLGLLLGLGIAGSYGYRQIQQARAETELLTEEARLQKKGAESLTELNALMMSRGGNSLKEWTLKEATKGSQKIDPFFVGK